MFVGNARSLPDRGSPEKLNNTYKFFHFVDNSYNNSSSRVALAGKSFLKQV
jgi:hypothetical protein